MDGRPHIDRRIIELKEMGYKLVEIAQELEVDERTVRRHLKRLSEHSSDWALPD